MKLVLFSLILCIPSVVLAQWTDGGRSETSTTASNGYLYVHDGVMYFFNYENYMQKSTDNGATWIDLADTGLGDKGPGLSRNVSKMEFNKGRLYAAMNYGNSGAPLYSTDGGDSWLPDTLGAPAGPSSLDPHPVISDMEVWGHWLYVHWVGNSLFTIKTDNGPHILNSYLSAHGGPVVSHGDTLFVLSAQGVSYTVDGGANFTTPTNVGFTGNLPKQLLLDGSRLYAFMHLTTDPKVYTLFYSDDVGGHWTQVDISAATNQKQMNGSYVSPIAAFIKGQRIEVSFQQTAFNTAPNVWRSTNLGVTWNADTVGLPNEYAESITNFAYTPDGYLWAVRAHENIYKQKIDAGESQPSSVNATQRVKQSVVFPNPARSEIVLQSGRLFELRDAMGRTIMQGPITSDRDRIDISRLTRGTYWVMIEDENRRCSIQAISLQ